MNLLDPEVQVAAHLAAVFAHLQGLPPTTRTVNVIDRFQLISWQILNRFEVEARKEERAIKKEAAQ